MKKLLIATAVAATFFAPQAFAQAKNFQGGSLGGNLVFASGTSEVSSPTFNTKVTENSTIGGFIAQYDWALSDKFVLGLGVSVGLGSIKAGNVAGVLPVTLTGNTSIFVTPGFALSDTTKVYGKVALVSTTAEYSTSKVSLSGTGFGFGVQSFINKNVYISGEYMVNTFEEKKYPAETDKWGYNAFSIGVGYKF